MTEQAGLINLPETDKDWFFLPVRDMTMAVSEDHGCWVYMNERWLHCYPFSNDPLSYPPRWYYNA